MSRPSQYAPIQVGDNFGRLTVHMVIQKPIHNKRYAYCFCSCGKLCRVRIAHLHRGLILSCGCWRRDLRKTHGLCYSATYQIWRNMMSRCLYQIHQSYKDYGARGITVCNKWQKFDGFIADMGLKPYANASIERKNSNGNYEPDNCIWIPRFNQGANTRKTRLITAFGKTQHLRAWSRECRIDVATLRYRLNVGTPVEQALTNPKGNTRVFATKPL